MLLRFRVDALKTVVSLKLLGPEKTLNLGPARTPPSRFIYEQSDEAPCPQLRSLIVWTVNTRGTDSRLRVDPAY